MAMVMLVHLIIAISTIFITLMRRSFLLRNKLGPTRVVASMTLRKLAATAACTAALLGVSWGVAAQAATIPPGTPSRAVVEMRNGDDNLQWFKLQDADPFTGRFGASPLGNGEVSHIRWTHVTPTTVNGTGDWEFEHMGDYQSGPVTILLTGTGWRYTRISVTLTESWYGHTNGTYPPYEHGDHFTSGHIHLAVNDPAVDLDRF